MWYSTAARVPLRESGPARVSDHHSFFRLLSFPLPVGGDGWPGRPGPARRLYEGAGRGAEWQSGKVGKSVASARFLSRCDSIRSPRPNPLGPGRAELKTPPPPSHSSASGKRGINIQRRGIAPSSAPRAGRSTATWQREGLGEGAQGDDPVPITPRSRHARCPTTAAAAAAPFRVAAEAERQTHYRHAFLLLYKETAEIRVGRNYTATPSPFPPRMFSRQFPANLK